MRIRSSGPDWAPTNGPQPTPYILALPAAVYGADSYQLLDSYDYAHLPAADRLVLDKHTRTPAQQHARPVGDPGGGGARISGSAAAFRTSQARPRLRELAVGLNHLPLPGRLPMAICRVSARWAPM